MISIYLLLDCKEVRFAEQTRLVFEWGGIWLD